MRALIVSALGGAPSVVRVPSPVPADDEVLVAMEAASLNPVDVAIASGSFYAGHPPLPYVPAIEGAGRLGDQLVYVNGVGLGISHGGVAAGVVSVPRAAVDRVA